MKYRIDSLPTGWPEPPFILLDSASVSGSGLLVVARSALAWVGLEYSPYDNVREVVVHDRLTSVAPQRGVRYSLQGPATEDRLQSIRNLALRDGATPEAIRYIHGYVPFTKKEVEDMAGKLSKKTDAPKTEKAPKAAKAKDAATEAPKSGRKGNPEALAKARAARAEAGPDTRKIKVLTKECPYREGSARAESFAALKGAKTVEEYIAAGGKKKYISRWAADGIIEVK